MTDFNLKYVFVSKCRDPELQFALCTLQPPHPPGFCFCSVQCPEHISVSGEVKLLQHSLKNRRWDDEVKVRISHPCSHVPCIAGHNSCNTANHCFFRLKLQQHRLNWSMQLFFLLWSTSAPHCSRGGFVGLLTQQLARMFVHHSTSAGPCLDCTCGLEHDRLAVPADGFGDDTTGKRWTTVSTQPSVSHDNHSRTCRQTDKNLPSCSLKNVKELSSESDSNLEWNSATFEGARLLGRVLSVQQKPDRTVKTVWWRTRRHQQFDRLCKRETTKAKCQISY